MVSFQKDRSCQCRDSSEEPSLGHRRLRFSFQINDFKDQGAGDRLQPFIARLRRRRRCSRLGIPCQAVIPEKNLFRPLRPKTAEALFSASMSRVKWFFLKKNLCPRTGPETGGGGCLERANLRVNLAFSAISRSLKSEDFRPQETVWKAREACLCFVTDDSIGTRKLTEHL